VWTFIAYIIYRLCEEKGKNVIRLDELYKLFFDVFWRECKLALVDSKNELLDKLRYLEALGALRIKGDRIEVNMREIKSIASIVENSTLKSELLIYRMYISRIEEGIRKMSI